MSVALGALVLGILGHSRNARRDSIRLEVTPIFGYLQRAGSPLERRVGVRVINHSAFDVSISEVGWLARGGLRVMPVPPIFFDRPRTMPFILGSGESMDAYADPGLEQGPTFRNVTEAFAETATKERFFGGSEALRRVVREGVIPPHGLRGEGPVGEEGVHSAVAFRD